MELVVYNTSGQETGRKVDFKDEVFGIEPNDHAIYLDVKQFLANQRQGTHKSKERSELSGSTRKLKKQKGGGARKGDINSPILRGGARVFGPRPRDYRFKLNKKLKRLARLSALSYKLKAEQVKIVEDFDFEAPKTKRMIEILKNLNFFEKKSVLVLLKPNKFVSLSSRNLPEMKVINASNLTTYDIMNAENVLFVESSAVEIGNSFSEL